jgi:RNA 3'-terminal phosphate cyclase (ATP)
LEEAGHHAEVETREITALDQGGFLFLAARDEVGSGGFSGLGGRGADSERVSGTTVDALLEFVKSDAACDPYLADQLVLPLALAPGTSRLTTSRVTSHLVTAVVLTQQILGCPAQVRGEVGAPGSVTIEGVGTSRPSFLVQSPGPRGEEDRPVRSSQVERPTAVTIVRKAKAADGPAIQGLLAI